MPVLDEAAEIEAALAALAPLSPRGVEVIVVDGGSSDGTAALAPPLADRVIAAPRGRAAQMNAGAAAATGDVLLFLHADTRLPENADRLVRDGLARSGRAWGRFDVRFDGGGLLVPDRHHDEHALAADRHRHRRPGDVHDPRGVRTRGRFSADRPDGGRGAVGAAQAHRPAAMPCARASTTSARRWRRHGTLRTVLLMWALRLRFFFGADPAKLARAYGYAEN